MSYPELINLIVSISPRLSNTSYKLLWHLIGIAITQRSNEVTISCAELARQIGVTRDAITAGHRQLATIFAIETRNGSGKSTFLLPAEWFEEWTLSSEIRHRPKLLNMPGNRAGTCLENRQVQSVTCLENRQVPSRKPGRYHPENQAGYQKTWGKTRQVLQNLPENQAGTYKERARALRLESSSCCTLSTPSGLYLDSVLRAVEISPEQWEHAQILREKICEYRAAFGRPSRYPTGPDRKILAQILAIAPIEQLCDVLNARIADRVPPGKEDAWFVTMLLEKCRGVPKETVHDRRQELKRKNPPMIENPDDFGTELLDFTAAGTKNF
jgi:hypothetical protein